MNDTACLECQRMRKTYGDGATCRKHTPPPQLMDVPFQHGLFPLPPEIFAGMQVFSSYRRTVLMSLTGPGKYRGMRIWWKM